MPSEHLIGLLLGTEEDWPAAYEALVAQLGPVEHRGERHTLRTERLTYEPFDLRSKPRYDLVVDRLSWWYHLPREWLKKVALMDEVYLLNNPFSVQSMEKHAAYAAMLRLGLKIPETWLIPHKVPPGNERFLPMAQRYNLPFDLEEVAGRIGYPLYMKPFDGGQWVGVTRIADPDELHRRYDESGERLMHLQAAVEPFDIFARSLSIGAETMVMRFKPELPMHLRYQLEHAFLSPELGREVETIGKLVNAFFRWEFNSCETIVKDGQVQPIDYANPWPDVAITSLHYYFPWAIRTLVRWTAFCAVTGRRTRLDQDPREWFAIADEEPDYDRRLARYRELAEAFFDREAYDEFCARSLPHLDELAADYFDGPDFDRVLVDTVCTTFPTHEHDQYVEHYRGLLAVWVRDQRV
jgi:hypothetical protein